MRPLAGDTVRKIAIIGGTGDQGLGLAMRFVQAGLPVCIGSRDETKARMAVDTIKEKFPQASVTGMGNTQAVKDNDIIILSVPYKFMVDTLKGIKEYLTPEKTLVSLCVPLASNVGGRPTQIIQPWEGSAAEQAQGLVPEGVTVVGSFHNVCSARLQDLDNTVDDDVVVCCNDKEKRKEIMELASRVDGMRGIDGGPLCNARIVESITALIIGMNIRYKMPKGIGIRFTYLYDI